MPTRRKFFSLIAGTTAGLSGIAAISAQVGVSGVSVTSAGTPISAPGLTAFPSEAAGSTPGIEYAGIGHHALVLQAVTNEIARYIKADLNQRIATPFTLKPESIYPGVANADASIYVVQTVRFHHSADSAKDFLTGGPARDQWLQPIKKDLARSILDNIAPRPIHTGTKAVRVYGGKPIITFYRAPLPFACTGAMGVLSDEPGCIVRGIMSYCPEPLRQRFSFDITVGVQA